MRVFLGTSSRCIGHVLNGKLFECRTTVMMPMNVVAHDLIGKVL